MVTFDYAGYARWRSAREAAGRRVNTAEARLVFTHVSLVTLGEWKARYEKARRDR